jgi:hypothetical protein
LTEICNSLARISEILETCSQGKSAIWREINRIVRTENLFGKICDASASTRGGSRGGNVHFGSSFFAILDIWIYADPVFKGKRWILELINDNHFPLNNAYFTQHRNFHPIIPRVSHRKSLACAPVAGSSSPFSLPEVLSFPPSALQSPVSGSLYPDSPLGSHPRAMPSDSRLLAGFHEPSRCRLLSLASDRRHRIRADMYEPPLVGSPPTPAVKPTIPHPPLFHTTSSQQAQHDAGLPHRLWQPGDLLALVLPLFFDLTIASCRLLVASMPRRIQKMCENEGSCFDH